ncbi:hypothetical protein WANG_p2049 (plasmid) [Lactobacillus kefiranofaciens subsp. kefiranofaciens]|nr:hypothetical protein WANG_p2049 [Lactobacillus kefiranofaciens subsp. kefiranofaciens]
MLEPQGFTALRTTSRTQLTKPIKSSFLFLRTWKIHKVLRLMKFQISKARENQKRD